MYNPDGEVAGREKPLKVGNRVRVTRWNGEVEYGKVTQIGSAPAIAVLLDGWSMPLRYPLRDIELLADAKSPEHAITPTSG